MANKITNNRIGRYPIDHMCNMVSKKLSTDIQYGMDGEDATHGDVTQKNINTMTEQNIKNTEAVISFNYKPFDQRQYFFGDDDLPKSNLIRNGKLDTSKRFIQINRRNIYNIKQGYKGKLKAIRPNTLGKIQGDKMKYKPRILPPQIFKKPTVIEPYIVDIRESWFESEKIIDYDFDDEFDDILISLDRHVTDNDLDHLFDSYTPLNPFAKAFSSYVEPEQEDVDILTEDLGRLNVSLSPIIEEQDVSMDIVKETQGLMTLAWDAISMTGGALGWYYTYKTLDTVYTAASSVGNMTEDVFEVLKSNIDVICAVLICCAKVYSGKMALDEAVIYLTGYLAGKILFKHLVPSLISTISNFVSGPVHSNSQQSTYRITHGGQDMTFVQAAIGLISTLILGHQVEATTFKGIMSSIRGLGSTMLTLKAVDVVLVNIVKNLPDIIRIILAETFPRFSLYCAISTDEILKKKLVCVNSLRIKDMADVCYNSHNLNVFFDCYDFFMKATVKEEYLKIDLHHLIKPELEWLSTTYESIKRLGLLPGKRHMPFVVWLSGEPGVGKSTYAKQLAEDYVKYLVGDDLGDNDISKYIYSHNTANKYFDGYNNQPVFILNDYLQFSTEEEEKWLIKFVDTIELPLEVSSVDNIDQGVKGEVRFTSRIIIVTSNCTYLPSSNFIKEVDAFNRRRDMVVNFKFKSHRKVDFDHFDYSWCNIELHDPLAYQLAISERLIDIESLTDVCFNRYLGFADRNIHMLNLPKFSKDMSLYERANTLVTIETSTKTLMVRAYEFMSNVMNKSFLGVGFKYWIGLVMAGSAGYVVFTQLLRTLVEKFTHSLSGDVTSKSRKKIYRPLRTTMGIDMNIDEVTKRLNNNIVRVTTIIDFEGKSISNTMWGVMLGGSLLCTPKHLLWRGDSTYNHGDTLVVEWNNTEYKIFMQDSLIIQRDSEDIAFINTLGVLPPFKSIMNHLILDNAKIQDKEDAVLITKKDVSFVQTVEAFMVQGERYIDPYGKIYESREMWQYNTKFRVGDCGSPLLLTDVMHIKKFAGIHVAGDNYSGNAAILTYEMAKEAQSEFTARKTQGFVTDVEMHDFVETDDDKQLDGNFVLMGKMLKPMFQHAKTDIVQSPLFEVLQPHMTEPSILSPSDNRNEDHISPMLKSIAKFGTPVIQFDRDLMSKAFELVTSLYEPILNHNLNVLDYESAINSTHTPSLEKLDISTSAGYPWVQMGLRKKDLILQDQVTGHLEIKQILNDKLNSCMNKLKNGVEFPCTLVATLKDERVSLAKVKECKTRTFTIFPVEFTILMRSLFDDFIDKETKYALQIGTTVGVNIYSSIWNGMYQDLKKYSHHIDGDFKAFDGTVRPEFFMYYARLVNHLYNDDEYSKCREILMSMCCFSPMIVMQDVYLKLQGNPSGSRVTTTFNSFVNRMYLTMVYLTSTPDWMHTVNVYKANLRIYAHGDDHLLGLSTELAQYMSAFKIRDFMQQHNIGYTSSHKTADMAPFSDLRECFYLKSYFVYDKVNNVMKAGLCKDVIQEMVSWQRDFDVASTEMIVNTALRYSYFWGLDYFRRIKTTLDVACKRRNLHIKMIDYIDLDNEYHSKGQLIFDF
jgi:hypothetical protein